MRIILKKIFEILTSLVVLTLLCFLLLKFLPGSPFDEEKSLNPIIQEALNKTWGLDRPFWEQGFDYLRSAFSGDLGVSMSRPGQTVFGIIEQSVGVTFKLNFISLGVVFLGAFFFSITSVRYKNTSYDSFVDQVLIALLSLPSLFWGPLLIYTFGFYFNLLPVALLNSSSSYILPVITLSIRPMASLARLLKTSFREKIQLDYVRTAKAKGVNEWGILIKHVLRNSMIPFLSYCGPLVVGLLSGSFLVEMLFAIPGLGGQFISALGDRDFTLIVGLTFFYGSLLIIVNSIFDVIMRLVDPRLRDEV